MNAARNSVLFNNGLADVHVLSNPEGPDNCNMFPHRTIHVMSNCHLISTTITPTSHQMLPTILLAREDAPTCARVPALLAHTQAAAAQA
jgi:hypothetical protein